MPQLPTDRIRRREAGPGWRSAGGPREGERALVPLALFERSGNADRIAATCELAAAAGLGPGLGLSEARARFPGFDFRENDPAATRDLLEALADWCDRYTPLVAVEPPDGLTLDIAGCAHLFGGEKALLDDLLARLFAFGLKAHASVAGGAGTARALARGGASTEVPDGAEAQAVAALPLEALRLDAELLATLRRLGLRTVGQLAEQPRAPLARRFGEPLLFSLDEATGRRNTALSPRLPVAPLIAERRFAEPLVLEEDVGRVLLFLAGRLEGDLERRGAGGRSFELALFRVDGRVDRVRVGTSRPLRAPDEVALLFRERFAALREELDSGFGYDLIRLSVPVTAPLRPKQASLAAGAEPDPERLAALIDRLAARLGEVSVTALGPVDSHWPERAERAVPAVAAGGSRAAWGGRVSAANRPARLLERPEQVLITQSLPDGPPLNFRWRRALHVVRRYEGPERIAAEWWRAGGDDVPARDYYRIEDERGRRYWLFRQEGADGYRPDWFMHGLFA
ncbi:Y-family DNA polymerase [Aureimonas leprariae]|uniref:Y-family DNA polymerase n=1 Tax=Plantimonas leprariae TaxID=2615207 RepID=UPI001FE81EE4|nr:DNA polymerase Y family protein [Aureimonas leprariae]